MTSSRSSTATPMAGCRTILLGKLAVGKGPKGIKLDGKMTQKRPA